MENNNIFKYATKELSQDAFICWLVEWVNHKEKNKELYEVSKKFLDKIIEKYNKKNININLKVNNYNNLEILRQYRNIDVLISFENENNETIYIIIEDKKLTSEHSNQINKYKNKLINKGIKEENIITTYYKMFYEPNQIDVDVLIDRKFMLEIMENYHIKNDIYIDYYNYLSLIEYKCKNIKKFSLKEISMEQYLQYELPNVYCSHSEKNEINKCGVGRVRGSVFYTWYIRGLDKNYFLDYLYLETNINKSKYELRIRGRFENKENGNLKYNEDERNKLQDKIEKYFLNKSNIKFEKFNKRQANESMILAKIKLPFKESEEYKVSDLLKLMEELERILDLFIENKEYKN